MRRILTVAWLSLLFVGQAIAQMMPPIPVDQEVRMGKLDNGLTYYIRHNEFPKDVANFYIAQRVGSINEEESQRGLAHFLEHMAFNGSENFPDNGIIEFTRTLGVEFGSNLNAYTSIDQTVYRICDVPTARQSALDSCLLVLKDWSCGLTLKDEEIDKERGVIHQEWQMRSSASQRFFEKHLPDLYPGSKYGNRLPIGLMSVVDNFKYNELRDYYHKWYRPDNQAIIVVGNVDVDHTEAEIKRLWKDVKVAPDAAQVIPEQVPDNKEPIYVTYQDKEQKFSVISVNMKQDAYPDSAKTTIDYLMIDYAQGMVGTMLNKRLEELSQQPDCPFVGAYAGYDSYLVSRTKDAFNLAVIAKEGKDIEALTTAMREVERARQYGFTDTEYERAKADYLSSLEQLYSNRTKTANTYFYDKYVQNYLANEPMPSIDDEYMLMNQLVPNIPVVLINQLASQMISASDSNLVVYEMAQEAEGKTYPTTDELRKAIESVRAEQLEAYVDNVKNEPLIAQLPEKGKITKTTEDQKLGFKRLSLSNGATVVLKKTDFQDDEVKLLARARNGGKNNYGEADYTNLKVFDYIASSCGLGEFSLTELQKALAGKKADANPALDTYGKEISGNATPKDVETMMQLVYLYFTDLRKDEKACQSLISQLEIMLKNKNLQPESVFSDSLQLTRYNHDPRFAPLSYDELKDINVDRIVEIHKEIFADASQFTFYIVGNFDEETLLPMIEQYIASLPSTGKAKDITPKEVMNLPEGKVANHFTRKMETPKAQLYKFWTGKKMPYTLESSILADAAGQVLSMKLLRTIREESSAAYSVGAQGFPLRTADKQAYYTVFAGCPMDPEKATLAYDLMMKGVEEAATSIDAEDVTKVKEYMVKQAKVNARDNRHWLDILYEYNLTGIDVETDYESTVNALTPESISAFVKSLLSSGDQVEVMMTPEQ